MSQTNYVYIRDEGEPGGLWTVGFYGPAGKWQPESGHSTPAQAADRVHWLNGANYAVPALANAQLAAADPQLVSLLERARGRLREDLAIEGHDPSVGIDNSELIRLLDEISVLFTKLKGQG